jgi:protein import protein ZIM17
MSSKTTPLFSSILRQARARATTSAAPLLRQTATSKTFTSPFLVRHAHSIPRPGRITPRETTPSSSDSNSESARPSLPEGKEAAYYQLSFTCVPCGHRSHHNISKQGYHTGSTLISCPECRNRHVISDHLGIFGDKKGVTIEDIMREKGQLVKRGSLGEDGDIEFWPDDKSQGE